MNQIEWYYARGNKQSGPVSSVELKRLADAGEIRPDDLVWREGMTEWSASRNVRGLFEEEGRGGAAGIAAPPTGKPGEAPIQNVAAAGQASAPYVQQPPSRHYFDSLLNWLRARFNANFIEKTAKLFQTAGFYGLYAAMALLAIYQLIVAVKTNSPAGLLSAAATILTLAVLQYTAVKFCGMLEHLNRTTSSISSTAFPDCFALLCMANGVGSLLGFLTYAFQSSLSLLIFAGIAGFIIWCYLALLALNLPTLNVSVSPQARAGVEAVGVLTFLLKALLQLVPVAFGAGVVLGAIMMGYACIQTFSNTGGLLNSVITDFFARRIVIFSAALPLIAYLVYLFYSLSLDLCQAVLAVPSKLDVLAEKGGEKKAEEKKAEEKKGEQA